MICAFCGLPFDRAQRRARTGEHVLPLWTLDYVPGEAGPVTHHRQSTVEGGFDQVWTADEFDVVAKRVCEQCNDGWMNDLENQARPFLIPMIRGHGKHLHQTGQELVASWCVKTALAVHLTTAEKAAPVEHYREIARTHRPPSDTWVWLAAYDGGQNIARHHSTALELEAESFTAYGYATTLAVGHFAFQVAGYSGAEEEVTFAEGPAGGQAKLRIWPYTGRTVIWPPRLVLDQTSFDAFAAAFEH